ncbi:uncharacterized protein YegU-like [Lineus longissimus]|uniref:uncharacterized protein YegU-like n=1 Tax=Lineus longissimus TaxID=88925 RepID=UPI002B4DD8DE
MAAKADHRQSKGETKLTLEHILGTIYGNCSGDAIGLLTEFMNKKTAKTHYGKFKKLEYEQKVDDLHRDRWETGDWTDDSDQMILIMLSLRDNDGKIDQLDFAHRIVQWCKHGYQELGDHVGYGIGSTTDRVLRHQRFDAAPSEAAQWVWEHSGRRVAPNGSVMRTSILGIHDYRNMDKVISNTKEICKTTHYDPRCQASCVAVTTAIAMMLQRQEKHMKKNDKFNIDAVIADSYNYAKEFLTEPEQIEDLHFHMYAKNLAVLELDDSKKIGFCFKCMGSGFWALRQKNYRKALEELLMQGGDADTNCAVAGALLGCKLGVSKIPDSWLKGLCHKEWLDKQIAEYLPILDKVLENGADTSFLTAFEARHK